MNLSSHMHVSLQTAELVQYFVPVKNKAAGTETFYWHQTILNCRQLHFVFRITVSTRAFLNPSPHSCNIHSPALTKMYRDMWTNMSFKNKLYFLPLSSGRFTKVMKQNLPWIHVPLYEVSFSFFFTKAVLLLLMPLPIVQTWFSKTTFQDKVIIEKVIQLLVWRWWYFVFCFFTHVITMLRPGEKEIISMGKGSFPSFTWPLSVTLHWQQSCQWSWK